MIFSLQGLGPAVLFWIYFNKPELLWGPSPRQRSGVQRGRVGSLDWDMMYIYNYIIIIIYISLLFCILHILLHNIYIYVKWLLVGFKTMLVDVVSMVSIAPHRWGPGAPLWFFEKAARTAATLGQAGSWGLGALGPWVLRLPTGTVDASAWCPWPKTATFWGPWRENRYQDIKAMGKCEPIHTICWYILCSNWLLLLQFPLFFDDSSRKCVELRGIATNVDSYHQQISSVNQQVCKSQLPFHRFSNSCYQIEFYIT